MGLSVNSSGFLVLGFPSSGSTKVSLARAGEKEEKKISAKPNYVACAAFCLLIT